jgi:signal transduction histidine kinase
MVLYYLYFLAALVGLGALVVIFLDLKKLDADLEFLTENSLKKSAIPPPNRLILLRTLGAKFRNLAYQHRRMTKLEKLRALDWKVLINGMSEMVLIARNDGKVMDRNRAFSAFFVRSDELESLDDFILSDCFDGRLKSFFEEARSVEEALDRTVSYEALGRQKYFWLRSSPIRNVYKKKIATLFLISDLSDQREADLRRREFVSNASHQLRTPLTLIQGYLETLIENPNLDENTRLKVTQKAHEGALALDEIMSDLLLLTKMENNGEELQTETVYLNQLVNEVLDSLESFAQTSEVHLQRELFSVKVQAHRELLKQAIHNIVENAVKYSEAKGIVNVMMFSGDEGPELWVQDQGVGISEIEHERVFNRFYRADSGSTPKPGTGLGLAISRHICNRHGIKIDLQSHPGKGSQFKLLWPSEGVMGRADHSKALEASKTSDRSTF